MFKIIRGSLIIGCLLFGASFMLRYMVYRMATAAVHAQLHDQKSFAKFSHALTDERPHQRASLHKKETD